MADRRGDVSFFAPLAEHLSRLPAVRSVEINPRTASILVRHDTDMQAAHLVDEIAVLVACGSAVDHRGSNVVMLPVWARRSPHRAGRPVPTGSELPALDQAALAELLVDLATLPLTRRVPARLVERGATSLVRLALTTAKARRPEPA